MSSTPPTSIPGARTPWLDRELDELDLEQLVARAAAVVLKRALGRVGDEVFVGELIEDGDWARYVRAVREAARNPGALGSAALCAAAAHRHAVWPTTCDPKCLSLMTGAALRAPESVQPCLA